MVCSSGTSALQVDELLAHAASLRRLATALLGNSGDADDLVQDTYLAALHSPPASNRAPRPWLNQVLRNFARMRARAGAVRKQYAMDHAEEDAVSEPADRLLERLQLQGLVAKLVARLEEPYRTAILLRFFEDRQPAEIALALGVPAGTVRWRINEGVRRLRGGLEKRLRARRLWAGALGFGPKLTLKGAGLLVKTKAKVGLVLAAIAIVGFGMGAFVLRQRTGQRSGWELRDHTSAGDVQVDERGNMQRGLAPEPPPPPKFAPTLLAGSVNRKDAGRSARDGLNNAIRAVIPAVKGCYEALLDDDPLASGRLELRLTITDRGGRGHLAHATVVPPESDGGRPELNAPLVEQCILKAVAGAPFEAPIGGDVVVDYPFVFHPKTEPDWWQRPCDSDAECAPGGHCLPSPGPGGRKLCTQACRSAKECPVAKDRRCWVRFPCVEGVCAGYETCP